MRTLRSSFSSLSFSLLWCLSSTRGESALQEAIGLALFRNPFFPKPQLFFKNINNVFNRLGCNYLAMAAAYYSTYNIVQFTFAAKTAAAGCKKLQRALGSLSLVSRLQFNLALFPILDVGAYMMPHFTYNHRPLRYEHFSYKDLRFFFIKVHVLRSHDSLKQNFRLSLLSLSNNIRLLTM